MAFLPRTWPSTASTGVLVCATTTLLLTFPGCTEGPQPSSTPESDPPATSSLRSSAGAASGNTEIAGDCTVLDSAFHWGRRIGGSPDPAESQLFGSVVDVELGPDLRTYVLDRQEGRIQVYDQRGEFLFRTGGPGEGPGELDSPLALAVDGDRIFVLSVGRTIDVIRTDGKFLARTRLETLPDMAVPHSIGARGDTLFVGLAYVTGGGGPVPAPSPPLIGVIVTDIDGQVRARLDSITVEDLERASYRQVPAVRRYVGIARGHLAVADSWHLPVSILTLSGGEARRFGGCLPEDPNAVRPPRNRPAGAVGGWNVSSDVGAVTSDRFARLVPYVDQARNLKQAVEIIDIDDGRAWSLVIPPANGRWRRFDGGTVRDSVAVFFNKFEGVVQWATLDRRALGTAERQNGS